MSNKGNFLPKWFMINPNRMAPKNAPKCNNAVIQDASSIVILPVFKGVASEVRSSSVQGEVHPSARPKTMDNKLASEEWLFLIYRNNSSTFLELPTKAVRYWYFTLYVPLTFAFTPILMQLISHCSTQSQWHLNIWSFSYTLFYVICDDKYVQLSEECYRIQLKLIRFRAIWFYFKMVTSISYSFDEKQLASMKSSLWIMA